jgi:hypothetical protein
MRSLLAASMMLFSIEAQASVIDGVPLFWAATGENPQYHEAAFQAQKAFFLQTGFTPQWDHFQSTTTDRTKTTTMRYIDDNTPLASKDVFAVAAVGYTLFSKKFTAGFANPFFPRLKNTITLSQNEAVLGFKITF